MDDDVTQWIDQLAQGDQLAAQRIWERYFQQLVRLARNKLGATRRRAADEEDVALSAFNSFYQGATHGRFPHLDDRHDLWKLLVTLTARKAVAHMRREHTEKRGGGAVRGESVFVRRDASNFGGGIGDVLGDRPSPAFAALVTEQCEHLLDRLEDDSLRKIVLLKLEGYSNAEIGEQLGCALRTVERKLTRIRQKWEQECG